MQKILRFHPNPNIHITFNIQFLKVIYIAQQYNPNTPNNIMQSHASLYNRNISFRNITKGRPDYSGKQEFCSVLSGSGPELGTCQRSKMDRPRRKRSIARQQVKYLLLLLENDEINFSSIPNYGARSEPINPNCVISHTIVCSPV